MSQTDTSVRGALPAEAASPQWPGWRKTDAELMEDFGVTRWKARATRMQVGAPTHAPGRKRGATVTTVTPLPPRHRPAAMQIAARIGEQSRAGGPAPSRQLLASRTRALSEAFTDGDRHAINDALVELAAGCGLMLDHLQRIAA